MDWPDVAAMACAAFVFANLFWAIAWSNAREAEASARRPVSPQPSKPKPEPSAFSWTCPTFSEFPLTGTASRSRQVSLSSAQIWRERKTGKLFRVRSFGKKLSRVVIEEIGVPEEDRCTRFVDTDWFFDEADLASEDVTKEVI